MSSEASNNIQRVIDIIYTETGFDGDTIGEYTYTCAVQNCMARIGLEDMAEYLRLLQQSRSELNRLIEEIVVPETWFFRDELAYDALLNELNKNSTASPYPKRILSLPCSTGEEPYSIAIKLLENGYTSEMFAIDAIDISQQNIIAAKRAKYRPHSFRTSLPEPMMQKYFIAEDAKYTLCNTVKNTVTFHRCNIFSPATLVEPNHYDAIFCRNMFIYFNQERKQQAFNKLHNALKKNGIFLIGHSEAAIIPKESYTPHKISRSFGFIKTGRQTRRRGADTRKTTSSKTNTISVSSTPRQSKKAAPQNNKPANTGNTPHKAPINSLEHAYKLADLGQFQEALKLILPACDELNSCEAYSLLGMIYSALEKNEEAEQALRKALFLEPHHVEAVVMLALLLERKGDSESAKILRNRLHKASAKDNQTEALSD